MSYLASFSKGRQVTDGFRKPVESGAHRFMLRWRSVSGSIVVNPAGGVILYRKYTRLGERIAKDHESERHFIVKELRKQGGVWDREYTWFAE